ncbi:MAG: protein translocase subunit SecF [Myxococcota bacterium]|nr:protein translocase subunit SecF [Myxococcota bacterium]
MEFFKPGTRYNFLSIAKPLVSMSIILVLASWTLVATKGLNFGIDFAGGTEALLNFKAPTDLPKLREEIGKTGLEMPEVVTYGHSDQGKYFVRSRSQSLLSAAEKAKLKATLTEKIGEPIVYKDDDETGEEVRVKFAEKPKAGALKEALTAAGFPTGTVNVHADAMNPEYRLGLPSLRDRLVEAMKAKYGDAFVGADKFESVGSAVGAQMRNQGILSVIYALLGILLYVSFRFDLRYSPGAVLALVHDVSITIGVFSLFGLEFNLPIIAALLAIVGYSLNDTIVVYDRIRETLRLGLGDTLLDGINISVSDCLSRTVLTSVTTFLAVLSIFIYGGGIIQNFALAMLIGVVIGTYSSIYIASPAVVGMDNYLKTRAQDAIEADKAVARARARG